MSTAQPIAATAGSSSVIPYGITAEVIGTLCIVISITCLKHFRIGLIYELALMLCALFVPALLILLYYRHVSPTPPTKSHTATDDHFRLTDLFTDGNRLEVGLYTFGYFLFTYSSYRLLPITIAMPIFVTYPVFDILLTPLINKTPGPNAKQWIGIVMLLAGVATFLHNATATVVTPTIVFGICVGFIGAVSIALRMIYTAHRPVMGAPVRPVAHVLRDHPEHAVLTMITPSTPITPITSPTHSTPTTTTLTTITSTTTTQYTPSLYHLSIQMLETSTIGMLCFLVLTALLASLPQRWITCFTRTMGIPKGLVSRSTDGGWPCMLLVFCIYCVFTFGGNTLLIAADDMLPTNLYACLVYVAVVLSMLSGYFVLGETVTMSELVGLLLIVVGGVGVVWWKKNPVGDAKKRSGAGVEPASLHYKRSVLPHILTGQGC